MGHFGFEDPQLHFSWLVALQNTNISRGRGYVCLLEGNSVERSYIWGCSPTQDPGCRIRTKITYNFFSLIPINLRFPLLLGEGAPQKYTLFLFFSFLVLWKWVGRDEGSPHILNILTNKRRTMGASIDIPPGVRSKHRHKPTCRFTGNMCVQQRKLSMGLPIQCCCLGWRGREQHPNPPTAAFKTGHLPSSLCPLHLCLQAQLCHPWIHVRQPYLHPLYLQLYQPQTQMARARLRFSAPLRATSESGCPHVHGLLWSELHLKSQTGVFRYGHRRAGP